MSALQDLRIALAQIEIVQAHPRQNLERMSECIGRAKGEGASLIVFPRIELADGPAASRFDEYVAGLSQGIAIVWGSRCAQNGRLKYDDEPYLVLNTVENGEVLVDVGAHAISHGGQSAHDLVVLSQAVPYTLKNPHPSRYPIPTIRVNAVGMMNQGKKVLCFSGGSAVYDREGKVLASLRDDFEEDFLVIDFEQLVQKRESVRIPVVAETERADYQVLDALVKTLRRFDKQALGWDPKWIIGLSGGLDSSVVASLLVLAFGPERVRAYNLATKNNSGTTKDNAAKLARALGVELRSGSIKKLIDATAETVADYGYRKSVKGLVAENVQARQRGHLLSTFAAIEGGVVVNNGNRVESALGYATLYGDAIGALSPIGDLTKVRLFSLARTINSELGCKAIPGNLIPRETKKGLKWKVAPSAELSKGQRDPMKWFYHDWLIEQILDSPERDYAIERIVEQYREDRLESVGMGKWVRFYGLDSPKAFKKDLKWVCESMNRSVFKRIQAPPAITIASPASVAAEPEVQVVL